MAARYCAEIASAGGQSRTTFLRRVHELLPVLYAAALALPSIETAEGDDEDGEIDEAAEDAARAARDAREAGDRRTHDQWTALYQALAASIGEPGNHYSEMFHPYDLNARDPVTGSLADDLADIYGDLSDGLAKWRRGDWARASWVWRFNFTVHWGEHATGALRALHALADQHELGFPGDPVADV